MFGSCFEVITLKNKIKKKKKNKIQRTTSLFLKAKASEAVPQADEK